MRFLVDTHVWLWTQTAPERLHPEVEAMLADESNDLLFSAASAWEMAIKYRIGKLPLPEPPETYIPHRLTADRIDALPVSVAHAARVATLPEVHRDPFDRLLVAQAQIEKLTLVTADPVLGRYEVELMMADRQPSGR